MKIEVGRTTIAGILKDAGLDPAPERDKKRTWKQFMKSHWASLYACDFFSVEVLGIFGAVRYSVFFVINLKTRAVQIAGEEEYRRYRHYLKLSEYMFETGACDLLRLTLRRIEQPRRVV